jgi:Uma2 family endonuclease
MSVPESLRFTYEDYVLLPDDRRYEVIDGELYRTPAPTPYHQTVVFVSSGRLAIVGEKYISEAPDLVVEVLSPGTRKRDRVFKAKRYARFGVREMWFADPERQTVEVLVNTEHGFRREALYAGDDVLVSPLLPGLEIPLARVF